MKRLTVFLLLPVLLMLLAGCQSNEAAAPTTQIPTVETTAATQAPTEAPTEPTVPQAAPEDLPFVQVLEAVPGVQQQLLLAGANSVTAYPLYDHTDAWLRTGTARKLAEVTGQLKQQGLGLLLWDAYQPLSAQRTLAALYPDFPWDDAGCRGSAVDVWLIDLASGQPLEAPCEYMALETADRSYRNCPAQVLEHAQLLEEVMTSCGFQADPGRWWRYTDTAEYPLEEQFDPAAPARWASTEALWLLSVPKAGSKALTQIPAGDPVTLLAFEGSYALVDWYTYRGYLPVSRLMPMNPDLWTSNSGKELVMYAYPNVGSAVRKVIKPEEACELVAWNFKFAQVSFEGKTGFVRAHYIQTADPELFSKTLNNIAVTDTYTYDTMMADLRWMALRYGDIAEVEIIGKSELGLDIPVLRIGSKDAQHHVLFQAAIHGREHMTAWLSMALADYWLDHNVAAFGDVCYHIIPMSNPDGVNISQTQTLNEAQEKIYRQDLAFGNTFASKERYASLWKANALGVDLNQNFAADWEHAARRSKPSSMRYKGESVFCAKEAQALRDYTLRYDFDVTISYHSEGSIIYYNYGEKQPVNTYCEDLASTVCGFTGYDMKHTRSCGGYKDWAIDALEIPSLTIETGCGDPPLEVTETYNLFFRNQQILPTLARWIQKLEAGLIPTE